MEVQSTGYKNGSSRGKVERERERGEKTERERDRQTDTDTERGVDGKILGSRYMYI